MIFCFMSLLAASTDAYSQLSFEIDSLEMRSVKDLKIDYGFRYVLHYEYEGILTSGPYLKVYGRLINNTEQGLIIASNTSYSDLYDFERISDIRFDTVFNYKGEEYVTWQYFVTGALCLVSPIMYPKYHKIAKVGEREMDILYLKPGESIAIETNTHFLKYSGFCHLKQVQWQKKHMHYNVRESRKLERIAFEVLPSIRIKPVVEIYDEKMYNTLLMSCRRYEEEKNTAKKTGGHRPEGAP